MLLNLNLQLLQVRKESIRVTTDQLTNYLLIALIIIIALARGVSVSLDFYIKKMELMHRSVPKQVIEIREKADWLVSEASTMLTLSGAEKKDWATNQLQKSNPTLTTAEARGVIQTTYDNKQKNQEPNESTPETATSLGNVLDQK